MVVVVVVVGVGGCLLILDDGFAGCVLTCYFVSEL